MQYSQLGNTDVRVSKICLGTMTFGEQNSQNEAHQQLNFAISHGVNFIDTAEMYPVPPRQQTQGLTETYIGTWLKSFKQRDKLIIASKVAGPGMMDYLRDGAQLIRHQMQQALEESLHRLHTDYIDLYQIHRPDPLTGIDETMEACLKLKEEGKIRAFGVSNMAVDLMNQASHTMDLASSQSPFSMVYRKIEKDILPYCTENGIGILAYSPLQRGLLTGKITSDYAFGKDDHRGRNKFFKEPNRSHTNKFLQVIKPIADDHGVSLAQLVINWTLRRKGITAALVGARNAEQAIENAGAMQMNLSDAEIELIDLELEKVEIDHSL